MVEVQTLGSEEGKEVVVLHGTPVPPESVEQITQGLIEDYRVYVVDYCGLGVDPQETVRRIEEALVAEGVEKPAIVGHSFGAYHAFQLATGDGVEVTGIAAIGPLAYLPDEVKAGYEELAQGIEAGVVDLADALLDGWFSAAYQEENPQIVDTLRRWFDELGDEALCRAARVDSIGEDLRPTLGAIDVPVYLCVGELDGATPPEWSEEIAELLPRAELDVVEGVGHFPHFEEREETVASIREFLGSL